MHEQEKFQERLIYHLGLRNNIKEREMHGLHCSSANWKQTNLDFYDHSLKKKTVTLDTEPLFLFSFDQPNLTSQVASLPGSHQVLHEFNLSAFTKLGVHGSTSQGNLCIYIFAIYWDVYLTINSNYFINYY